MARRSDISEALPRLWVRMTWGVTDRHARRLIESGDAATIPVPLVAAMIRAGVMVGEGIDPAKVLAAFEDTIREHRASLRDDSA